MVSFKKLLFTVCLGLFASNVHADIAKEVAPYTVVPTSTISPISIATVKVDAEVATAHRFLSDSSLRRELYGSQLIGDFRDALAHGLNKVAHNFILRFINLRDIKLGFKLEFDDGATILVMPDAQLETLVVLEGATRDSDKNTIPTNRDMLAGRYTYTSAEGYMSMKQYLEINFAITELPEKMCTKYTLDCSDNGRELSCSLSTCEG